MTQEKITNKFNGHAKIILDTIKLWLPIGLGLLSLITSLYTYRLKSEIREEIKIIYLSKEEFAYSRKDLDRAMKVTETLGSMYVTKEQWDKTIPVIETKINDTLLTQARVNQTISNLESLMKDVRDELRGMRKQ
jgi:hypothetical protein